jgi:hypothetical protein
MVVEVGPEIEHLLRRRSSSDLPPDSGDQPPVHTKTSPVPADDGFRRDDEEGVLPSRPDPPNNHPEERGRGSGADVGASAQRVAAGARDSPIQDSRGYGKGQSELRLEEKHAEHGKQLYQIDDWKYYCKLLILRSARVLARDTRGFQGG